MTRFILAAMTLAATLAATPAGAAPVPPATQTATVSCKRVPLFLVRAEDDRPYPGGRDVTQGQTFTVKSPKRTTLGSVAFYETDIPIVEIGPDFVPHYFVPEGCISLDSPAS